MPPYLIVQCENGSCRFRFPATSEQKQAMSCPLCGAPIKVAARIGRQAPRQPKRPAANVVEALLDNIRSVYNVGSMFRTADGAGIQHMYLCGITTTPDHPRVGKTALGAEQVVPWTRERNGVDAAVSLRARGFQLWAIEESPQALPLFETVTDLPQTPIVIVVGNEIIGIDPDILAQCERQLWIPMQGHKQSLNVAVAFGIAAYFLRYAAHRLKQ
jgi:23S rRNA (guanosine2251-2'-O)-methyltransferase